jgi:hypothetical protein
MMPIWTITLGPIIFTDRTIQVPFGNIAALAAGFAVPLLAIYNFPNFLI